jgi:hypothetical protein
MLRASWIALVLVGCGKPPAEAPEELGDLGSFLFQHFDDEDPAEMNAALLNLRDYILGTDLTQDPKDSAVTMPILEGEALDGLSIPEGVTAAEQVPVALSGLSIHALDDQLAIVFEPNQVCIESATTEWAQREFLTDTGCFEDGSCVELAVLQEVYKTNALASVWYDQYKDYRWYDLMDEDGAETRALLGRSWIEDRFVGDGFGGEASWNQLFHLDAFIENPDDPGTSLRWFSLWSSVTIFGIGDDDYAGLVKTGISEALLYGDEFISGSIESCKLDRDAEKPPRE